MRRNLLRETRELLRAYGVRPRKRLGQNFMVSRRALRMIVETLDLKPGLSVYEIGAGLGSLTLELARKGAFVVAIEIDPKLVAALRDRFHHVENVNVIRADALSFPIPKVDRVAGNVPYSISSKLIVKLLREPYYELAVLTLQREFALRLIAKPGERNYGRISVIVQLYSHVEVVGSVSRKAFYPQPDVDSLVVRIQPRRKHTEYFNHVEKLTARLFSQRRRKVGKVLKRIGVNPAKFREIIDLDKRVYMLSPDEILALAMRLSEELL